MNRQTMTNLDAGLSKLMPRVIVASHSPQESRLQTETEMGEPSKPFSSGSNASTGSKFEDVGKPVGNGTLESSSAWRNKTLTGQEMTQHRSLLIIAVKADSESGLDKSSHAGCNSLPHSLKSDEEAMRYWNNWHPANNGAIKGWFVSRGLYPQQDLRDKRGRLITFKSMTTAMKRCNALNTK